MKEKKEKKDNGFEEWYNCLKTKKMANYTPSRDIDIQILPVHELEPLKIHVRDNDVMELFTVYQKIHSWIEDIKARSNKRDVDIEWLRNLCQNWLDDVSYRQDLPGGRKYWMDMFIHFLRGQYKARLRWRKVFFCIAFNIADELDELDGGVDIEPKQRIGFMSKN